MDVCVKPYEMIYSISDLFSMIPVCYWHSGKGDLVQ